MELPSDIFLPYLQPPCPCCTSTARIRASRSQPPQFRHGELPLSSPIITSYYRNSTPNPPNQIFTSAATASQLLSLSSPNQFQSIQTRSRTPPLPPSKLSLTPQQHFNNTTSSSISFPMVPINRHSLMPGLFNNNINNKSSQSLQTFKSSHSSTNDGRVLGDTKFTSASLEDLKNYDKNNNNQLHYDDIVVENESLETPFLMNNHIVDTNHFSENVESNNTNIRSNCSNVMLTEEMENCNENRCDFLGIV